MFNVSNCFLSLCMAILVSVSVKAESLNNVLAPVIAIEEKKLHENDKKIVILEGYLFKDREVYLFPDSDALNKFSSSKRVTLKIASLSEISEFHGCFVSVLGKLKVVTGKEVRYILENVESIKRTGLFYDMAKSSDSATPPKCYLRAITEVMRNN